MTENNEKLMETVVRLLDKKRIVSVALQLNLDLTKTVRDFLTFSLGPLDRDLTMEDVDYIGNGIMVDRYIESKIHKESKFMDKDEESVFWKNLAEEVRANCSMYIRTQLARARAQEEVRKMRARLGIINKETIWKKKI